MLGRSQALKVMLSNADITARQALTLGLVDEVVPPAAVQDAARNRARRLADKPPSTVAGLKRLLNYSLKDLENYLDFENAEILRTLRYAAFLTLFLIDELPAYGEAGDV